MTAAEQQTVDMLLKLVEANERKNERAHEEIKDMIGELKGTVGKARAFELSLRTIGKFILCLASAAGVITGAVAGIQALL